MWRPELATRLVVAALAGLVAAAIALPAAAAAAVLLGRPRPLFVAVALVALAWGAIRVDALERRVLAAGDWHGTLVVTGRPNGPRAIARAVDAGEDVLLVARSRWPEQGDLLRVTGTLRPIEPPVRDYYATQGAHMELRAANVDVVGRRGGFWGAVDALHRGALHGLGADRAPPAERALVAGIALGEGAALPRDVRERFRASGLLHIVAASGQNVALVVALTLVAAGAAGVLGAPARLAALGAVVAYVLVAGAGASILRAGVAGSLTTVAWLVSRPSARWHLYACGAVVVLAANPLALLDPGFQLSFAAVAAIFCVAPRLERFAGQAVAVSVACSLATAPIAWWHFGQIAGWSVPANLLALPAVAPVLWLGVTAAMLAAVWAPLAAPLLALADVLAAYLLWIAELFGGPG
jgi:competence protein ComEC